MNAHFRNLMLAAAFCGSWNGVAQAQLAPQAPVAGETKTTREIRLKNVSPSLMSWWLDPKNYPTPRAFADANRSKSAAADTVFSLPVGVERLRASGDGNCIRNR